MRRKKFRTIYGDVDGLESPEGPSLVVPSRRLFSPNLSKSAPCKCCAATPGTCAACTLPPIKLIDSLYGTVNLTFSSGTWNGTNATAPAAMTANGFCYSNCITHALSTTTNISYQMTCHAGSPDYFQLAITVTQCSATGICLNAINCATATAVNKVSCLVQLSPIVLFPVDCTNPNFSFTIVSGTCDPADNACLVFYGNGATFTIVPQ